MQAHRQRLVDESHHQDRIRWRETHLRAEQAKVPDEVEEDREDNARPKERAARGRSFGSAHDDGSLPEATTFGEVDCSASTPTSYRLTAAPGFLHFVELDGIRIYHDNEATTH